MMGSERKRQFRETTETVTRAVKSAGSLVIAALVIAGAALLVALAALTVSVKARPAT